MGEMAMFLLNILLISYLNATDTQSLLKEIKGIENFKCSDVTKIPYPVRINSNGIIECLSLNGVGCLKVSSNGKKCRNSIHKNLSKNKPVSCPKNILSIKDKNNWCRKAYDYFFKKWQCPENTGINTTIRLNPRTFNIECISKNGKACLWGGYKYMNKICKKANSSKKFQSKILEMDVGSITGKARKNIYGGNKKHNYHYHNIRNIISKNKGKAPKNNSINRLKYISLIELSGKAKARNSNTNKNTFTKTSKA